VSGKVHPLLHLGTLEERVTHQLLLRLELSDYTNKKAKSYRQDANMRKCLSQCTQTVSNQACACPYRNRVETALCMFITGRHFVQTMVHHYMQIKDSERNERTN
jgi:hypothetical protein